MLPSRLIARGFVCLRRDIVFVFILEYVTVISSVDKTSASPCSNHALGASLSSERARARTRFVFYMYVRTHSSIVPRRGAEHSSCRRSIHSLSLSLYLSLALPTCCFTHKRKKSRLVPLGCSRGRQYDVSSPVTIRRRQTDSHRDRERERGKRETTSGTALFFLFSKFSRDSLRQKFF